jgi:hypothetical protein
MLFFWRIQTWVNSIFVVTVKLLLSNLQMLWKNCSLGTQPSICSLMLFSYEMEIWFHMEWFSRFKDIFGPLTNHADVSKNWRRSAQLLHPKSKSERHHPFHFMSFSCSDLLQKIQQALLQLPSKVGFQIFGQKLVWQKHLVGFCLYVDGN